MGADASKLQQQHFEQHRGKPVLQHSMSLDMGAATAAQPMPVPPHPSMVTSEATTPIRPKGKKKDYHYSDFSLYPDRFTAPPKTIDENMTTSKSAYEGGFLDLPERGGGISTSVSNPVGFSSRVGNFTNQSASEHKADFEKFRRRVNSQGTDFSASPSRDSSPKIPFFDFSMIEKDPKSFVPVNKKAAEAETLGVAPPRRQRMFSVGDEVMRGGAERAAEAAEAPQLRVKDPRLRKTSEPPKFSFFDYSMIPDKMDTSVQPAKAK